MIRSLWNGASGMVAQQSKMDIISNNIANINTTSYKKQQANFSDLLYQNVAPNQPAKREGDSPKIIEGAGVRLNNVRSNFTQGTPIATENELDIALLGNGFLEIELPQGEYAYTRDGSMQVQDGSLWTSTGYRIAADLDIPADYKSLKIDADGSVRAILNDDSIVEAGYIPLIRINNPDGLIPIGQNLFAATEECGDITEEFPGENGMALFRQGYLEGSNVEFASEMTQMILTQRAYQMSSKSIQTADEMWSIANNIRK